MSTISSPRQPPPQAQHPPPPQSPSHSLASARSSLSIDRPNANPTSTAAAAAAAAPRRNRTSALRDYYNLPASSNTTTTADLLPHSPSSSSPPPHNQSLLRALDIPGFDAAEYVRELLRTASLEELLRVEAALVGEIGGADGERKALVYDNYGRLIDATETIGRMRVKMEEGDAGGEGVVRKSTGYGFGGPGASTAVSGNGEERGGGGGGINVRARVGPMVETIGQLARSVAAVDAVATHKDHANTGTAATLNGGSDTASSLPQRHSDSVSEQQKQKQKQTVRWVLDSPRRLRELVDHGKREEAEAEWARVGALLAKWEGVKGVDELKREAEAVFK